MQILTFLCNSTSLYTNPSKLSCYCDRTIKVHDLSCSKAKTAHSHLEHFICACQSSSPQKKKAKPSHITDNHLRGNIPCECVSNWSPVENSWPNHQIHIVFSTRPGRDCFSLLPVMMQATVRLYTWSARPESWPLWRHTCPLFRVTLSSSHLPASLTDINGCSVV